LLTILAFRTALAVTNLLHGKDKQSLLPKDSSPAAFGMQVRNYRL
jgi:hypothetical protein